MLQKVKGFGKNHTEITLIAAAFLIVAVGGLSTMVGQTSSRASTDSYTAHAQRGTVTSAGASTDLAFESGQVVETERKRIESFDLDFEAKNVREAVGSSKRIAEDFGGYSTSERFYNNHGRGDSASVTVRVPKENVSEFLNELEAKNWKLDSKNRNIDDVTDRYTELELELKNKRQELQRLEELMNESNKTEDLIKIQERMSELRSRIQYLESQLADIDKRVDYTRIDLNFDEPEPITSEFELRGSFRDAYRAIFTSINWMIVGIGYLLPFAAVYAVYRFFKKRRGE